MSRSFHFSVAYEDAGQRLDEFLASRFGGLSRMRIASLIAHGACLLNGNPARAGHRITAGELIEISLGQVTPTAMTPEPMPLEVVYEDDHLIMVVKPAGMLAHPTMNVKSGTLANALAYHLNKDFYDGLFRPEEYGTSSPQPAIPTAPHGVEHSLKRPGIIHRLDRATSGLMVVAKTPRALSILSRHFRRRLVEKRYLAVVHGYMATPTGAITAPIGRDAGRRPQWGVMENGKAAETRFRILERIGAVCLIELEPVTGRTNQLRIHCAYSGHSIVGDDQYGRDSLLTHSRLCLHAWRLAFHHPSGGEWMEFTSELPPDIASFLDTQR